MASYKYVLLSLIQPFWALGIYIASISRRIPSNIDLIISTLTISILGIYWYPWGDSQTHFAIYYADIVNRFYDFSIFDSNYIYDYILTLIANITGNYVWGYYCWICIPLMLYNLSIWKYAKTYKAYSLLFICLLLFIGCREILDLNRNTAAALLFATALLHTNNKGFCITLLCFSSLVHSTIMIVLICGIIFHLILCHLTRSQLVLTFVVSFCISFIFGFIISQFASERIIDMYVEGVAGIGITVPSGFFYLMTVINIIIAILIGITLINSYNQLPHKLMLSCYFVSCCITLASWYLWTMRERFLLVNIILGFSVVVILWNDLKNYSLFNRINCIKGIVTFSIIRLILVFGVEYSSEFIHKTGSLNPSKTLSIVSRPYYLPTPFLIQIDKYGFNDYYYQKLFSRSQSVIQAHKY